MSLRPPQKALALALFLVTAVPFSACHSEERKELQVYAAASLGEALMAALSRYQATEAVQVRLTQGLSADLAKKIDDNAPADIFVSSVKPLIDGLAAKQRVEASTISSPIGNDLVLIAPADSALDALTISRTTDFNALLGPKGQLATGDPDYVALGVYAMEALRRLGQWTSVEPRLARASSVQAALELVESGKAKVGINFSTAVATSKKVKVLGRFPMHAVTPIRYTFAIVKGRDNPRTRKLLSYLTGPDALRIYAGFGFTAARL